MNTFATIRYPIKPNLLWTQQKFNFTSPLVLPFSVNETNWVFSLKITPRQDSNGNNFKTQISAYSNNPKHYKHNVLSSQYATLTKKSTQESHHSNATLNYVTYVLHACGFTHVSVGRKKPHRKRGNCRTQIGTLL